MRRWILLTALLLTACADLLYIEDTPTATQPAPTGTRAPTRTAELVETATRSSALYEAEVIVERLRLRDAAGQASGEYLPFGKQVTVIEQRDVLGDLAVPEPPGGQWCLIAPEELGDWVACGYLRCTRHCQQGE